MALPDITAQSFDGWINIVANQFKATKLEEYIILFREEYLRQIVGDAAYYDITNESRVKWDDLLDGIDYTDKDGKRRYNVGLVKALIRFIYFEFIRDNFTSSQTGKEKGKSANSERATDIEVLDIARNRYNAGVSYINRSIAPFLEANSSFTEEVTASIDNADNTYTLNIPNTQYLQTDEKVLIDGVEYTLIDAVDDISIHIDAGAVGLDFTGKSVYWEPYGDVDFKLMEICGL